MAVDKTVSDVLTSLKSLIIGQIMLSQHEGIEPFSDFTPAPQELWDRYEQNQATEADAFDVDAFEVNSDIQSGDLQFDSHQAPHTKFSAKALMKLAA